MTAEIDFLESLLNQLSSKAIIQTVSNRKPDQLPAASRPFLLKKQDVNNLDKSVQVNVKALKGGFSPISITLSVLDPIAVLKHKIEDQVGIPASQQRLLISGKALIDTRTLFDYNVKDSVNVILSQKATTSTTASEPVIPAVLPTAPSAPAKPAESMKSEDPIAAVAALRANEFFWNDIRTRLEKELSKSQAQHVLESFKKSLD